MSTIEILSIVNPSGYIKLIMGPMFSGKTTHLIHSYHTHKYQDYNVFVLNYIGDTRYSNSELVSHDKDTIPCIFSKTLGEIWYNTNHLNYSDIHEADIILINEAQFFPDIYDCVIDMVESHHKKVYLYGLDGDFQKQPFLLSDKGWLDLIPYADSVKKLNANCKKCSSSAIFSHRLTKEEEQIVIGANNYIPLCRKCYHIANT